MNGVGKEGDFKLDEKTANRMSKDKKATHSALMTLSHELPSTGVISSL